MLVWLDVNVDVDVLPSHSHYERMMRGHRGSLISHRTNEILCVTCDMSEGWRGWLIFRVSHAT